MKTFLKTFGILFLSILILSFTWNRVITGKVTDASGNPLAGVTIKSVPPGNSATSASDGIFSISVSPETRKLVFSVPGYETKTVEAGTRNIINVSLDNMVERAVADEMKMESKAMPSSYRSEYQGYIPGGFSRRKSTFNTEGYASINENGYRDVKVNPLSTFSIDVDNASYSNIRRFINNGQLPPPDAVRIEEMINYFRYNYPEPSGEHPFSVYTELASCPWNKKNYLLHVGLKAKNIQKASLPPANLVFLIDVSGSMSSPGKLPLLKSAFGLLVNELRPQDRVAVVVYAGAAGLALESTPGNRKEAIMAAIDNLEAGGSTAGGEGLRLAYREAEKNFIKNGNNRIILATDGDFNVGESSNGSMERLVSEKRDIGVYITVLGFGMGNIKDDKMEIIADKGNGNYSYIDNLQEARKVLVSEFGGTLFTVARDVKFQIEFNPARIHSYRLIGYENRLLNEEDFNDDTKDAGEMGSGHNVTALYELVPAGAGENRVDPLKYQRHAVNNDENESYSNEYLTIKVRYKLPGGTSSRLLEKPVRSFITEFESTSENLRFAAAVSEFGMVLRDSEFRGSATLENAALLAGNARGADDDGYKAELIRLINTARDLRLTEQR